MNTTHSSARPEPWQPPTPEELSGLLPGYEITALLGRGGMGAVYKGTQLSLDREVAIKLLPPDLGADPDFQARFRREAKSMAKLNHPNIVQIFDYGQTASGQHYFIMEYVDGSDLLHLVRSGTLDAEGALNAVSQVCEALQYAHELGFVHRDIKPANILINRKGVLKVGDFGLAKLVEGHGDHASSVNEEMGLTMTGMTMGTPHYAAPEQLDGQGHIDHRADLYSLGIMFYEMLTRDVPRGTPKAPSRKIPNLDVRIDGVVFKAMEPDPDERYQSASALRTDIELIRNTPPAPRPAAEPPRPTPQAQRPQARPSPPRSPVGPSRAAKPPPRKSPFPLTAVIGTLVILGGIFGYLQWQGSQKGPDKPDPTITKTSPSEPGSKSPNPISPKLFEPGPLVYEHSLTRPATLEELYCFGGQHGGDVIVEADLGLKFNTGHTQGMAWVRPSFGEQFRIQFEVQLPETGWADWILNGPGYGLSPNTGYSFSMDHENLTLKKEGVVVLTKALPQKVRPGEWAIVQTDFNSANMAVTIDGIAIATFSDAQPLTGPLHGWVGMTGQDSVFRNLQIWSSAMDATRPRIFTPSATATALPNGKLLYELKSGDMTLGEKWWKNQLGDVSETAGMSSISGGRTTSPAVVILTTPLTSQMACEVEFEYPDVNPINFQIKLLYAEKAPESSNDCGAAWFIDLPQGKGRSEIRRDSKRTPKSARETAVFAGGVPLASTEYFSPVYGRKYTARFETIQGTIRVFLDGGLLLSAREPPSSMTPGLPLFIGFSQSFSRTLIYAVRVYEISPDKVQ